MQFFFLKILHRGATICIGVQPLAPGATTCTGAQPLAPGRNHLHGVSELRRAFDGLNAPGKPCHVSNLLRGIMPRNDVVLLHSLLDSYQPPSTTSVFRQARDYENAAACGDLIKRRRLGREVRRRREGPRRHPSRRTVCGRQSRGHFTASGSIQRVLRKRVLSTLL